METDLDVINENLKHIIYNSRKIVDDNFDIDYGCLLPTKMADEIFDELEKNLDYYEGDLAKVKVFGKWHPIPRKQVAYGDDGIIYKFSGLKLSTKKWTILLKMLRDLLMEITGYYYNFVLINKYRDGNDKIGFHRDDEKELDSNTPIASLSLGQSRIFVFKFEKRTIKINLEHGSLLLMNPPTNKYWYHSIPPKKNLKGVRLNLTFRKINLR